MLYHFKRTRLLAFGLALGLVPLGGFVFVASAQAGPNTASAAPVSNGAAQVHVTLTNSNGGTCLLDYNQAKAGPVTFRVTNKSATDLTEVELLSHNRILGEKENLAPGLPASSFTVTLDGGRYQIYCPGAHQETQSFEVTGQTADRSTDSTTKLLDKGVKGYAKYVDNSVGAMVVAVKRLKAAIDADDFAKAKVKYPLARVFYERIESDVEGFAKPGYKVTDNAGSYDYLIDMRASNLDPKVGWHGFHAIERDLFKRGKITNGTKKLAAELLTNVQGLDKLVPTLKYRPEDLANGAADLLEEVQTSKITGEEEAFSHYDVLDMAANIEGAQQAFAFLEPGLKNIDPKLTRQVKNQFARVDQLLDNYRDRDVPGGFVLYTPEFKKTHTRKFSRAVAALQSPFSEIAEKVATYEAN